MLMRVKGVKRVRAKGNVYHYHRKTGERIKASPEDAAAFLAEVQRLDARVRKSEGPKAKTLGALIEAYRAHSAFLNLAPRTKRDYEKVFDWLAEAREAPLWEVDSASILEIQEDAFQGHKRRFANYVVAVLSVIFTWGKPRKWLDTNPADGIPQIAKAHGAPDANRPWEWWEFDVVLTVAPEGLRSAMVLGLFMREGNVIRFPRSGYDGTAIALRQRKTEKPQWVPMPAFARAVLDSAPRRSPVLVVGKRGRPYEGESGFRANFFRFIRELERDELVNPDLTFHGLRTSMATWAADAGADVIEIAALLGHRSKRAAEHYARGADRKRAAASAIAKLERPKN